MSAPTPRLIYESRGWEIDLARRELRTRGRPVVIGSRAFEIVETLAQSAGGLVTKDQLLDRVWRGTIVLDNTLQVHISAVRKALGADRSLLKTDSGRGYRLLGNWSVREAGAPAISVATGADDGPVAAGNVPAIAAELVGRSDAVQRVRDLLSAYRAVTLTGPGGIGKTALALEVARAPSSFDGERWLIELASLSDPGLVPSAVASVLGLRIAGSEISAEPVARAIGDRKLLLLLDNCEHVIAMAATVAETILRLCPNATVLTTSREALRIVGEHVYRVLPLDVPPPGRDEPSDLLDHSAVQLFLTRAVAFAAEFSGDAGSLSIISGICRRLDGIPLAIEFAAARAATLGLSQVATLIDDRFRLLTGGRRTALPRHQTLRATLDWSYGLLGPDEQLFLRALGIFAGGFTVDAAAAVAADAAKTRVDAIDRLADLVTKSLVVADVSGTTPRFRLLDTTRAYAIGKLDQDGERERLARHHAEYYRRVFERAEGEAAARPADEWLADYAREIDNLRAALDWAFSPGGDGSIGVALTAAAVPLWMRLSLPEECRGRAERALAILRAGASRDARREMKLRGAVAASLTHSRGAAASPEISMAYTRVLELAESLRDTEYQLGALRGLWAHHSAGGRLRLALELAQRFHALAVERPDPNDRLTGEGMIGVSQHYLGDLASARRHMEHVLAGYVTLDQTSYTIRFNLDQRMVLSSYLARVLWLQGFPDQAIRTARSTVEDIRAANHTISLCMALAHAACPLALLTGDLAAAEHYSAMLLDYSTRQALTLWHACGRSFQGVLVIRRGDVTTGLRLLRAGFDEIGKAGSTHIFRLIVFLTAEALDHAGQNVEGLAAIEEALSSSEHTEEYWATAELVRAKGELLLLQGAPSAAAAEDHFRRALDLAHRQGALSWELRAATSLARLLQNQGRPADAIACLEPVYDRFTEGFSTADLVTAKQLLNELNHGRQQPPTRDS